MVVRHSEGGRAGEKLVSWVGIGRGDSDVGWKLELGTGTLSLEVSGVVRAEERVGRGGGDAPSGREGTSGLVSADAQQQAARMRVPPAPHGGGHPGSWPLPVGGLAQHVHSRGQPGGGEDGKQT